jgi:hypothetical protein
MKILVNSLVLIFGVIVGMVINMLIIKYGVLLIPNPIGYDNTSIEGMQSTIHLLEPKHYITPWLAHALGTLIGALITFNLAKSSNFILALVVCIVFLIGGSVMVLSLPSPMLFTILDLGLAYLPMAWIVKKYLNFKKV